MQTCTWVSAHKCVHTYVNMYTDTCEYTTNTSKHKRKAINNGKTSKNFLKNCHIHPLVIGKGWWCLLSDKGRADGSPLVILGFMPRAHKMEEEEEETTGRGKGRGSRDRGRSSGL